MLRKGALGEKILVCSMKTFKIVPGMAALALMSILHPGESFGHGNIGGIMVRCLSAAEWARIQCLSNLAGNLPQGNASGVETVNTTRKDAETAMLCIMANGALLLGVFHFKFFHAKMTMGVITKWAMCTKILYEAIICLFLLNTLAERGRTSPKL
jgi:hypothetical protein